MNLTAQTIQCLPVHLSSLHNYCTSVMYIKHPSVCPYDLYVFIDSLCLQIEEEEEQYQIAGGVTTTAEPRPNAYIPDDDSELPIPRPYGKHAPFKPTENGTTMRHIRKPVPKPIEI